MSRIVMAACVLVVLVGTYQIGAGANGVSVPSAPASSSSRAPTPRTPEEMAVDAYNRGLDNRTRGLKAEEQAAKSQKDSDRLKNEKKAREEYQKAFKLFKQAADLNPTLPQAWNGMGFGYRKLGEYDKALESYDKALQLAPNFPDAIEYRGEAFLALNRLEDAKQAYLALFAMDRQQAELLMKAMSTWVEKRKTEPAGADPSAVAGFESWIKERATLAQQTRLMAPDTVYRPW